jgi:hypothetical protein
MDVVDKWSRKNIRNRAKINQNWSLACGVSANNTNGQTWK